MEAKVKNVVEAILKNKKRSIAVIVLLIIVILGIRACGGGADYDGYYIMNGDKHYALCISKDGTAVYSSDRMNWRCSIGYMEELEECAALYFNKHYNPEAYVEKYCPLYVTLSEDGKRMYLSSDNSNWNTDIFEVVDKKTYEAFVEEHKLITEVNNY